MSAPCPTPSIRAAASEPLRRFLQVARGAGLRVSAAEGIDAARAADLVGFSDRTLLKDTLGLVLAKTADEKVLYDETFELYFQRDEFSGANDPETKPSPEAQDMRQWTPDGLHEMGSPGGQSLSELLASDERAALAMAMEIAARESGIEKIRYLTQKNRYARRILEHMGLHELEQQLAVLRRTGTPDAAARAQFLEERVERLWDAAPARPAGRTPHSAPQYGLGRHSVHYRMETEADRESAGDGPVRRFGVGGVGVAVPADVSLCLDGGAFGYPFVCLRGLAGGGERHPREPIDR